MGDRGIDLIENTTFCIETVDKTVGIIFFKRIMKKIVKVKMETIEEEKFKFPKKENNKERNVHMLFLHFSPLLSKVHKMNRLLVSNLFLDFRSY